MILIVLTWWPNSFQSCSPQLSIYWWSALPSPSGKFPPLLCVCVLAFMSVGFYSLCISEIYWNCSHLLMVIFWWSSFTSFLLFWVNFIPITVLMSLTKVGEVHSNTFNYSANYSAIVSANWSTFSRKACKY